MRLGITMFATDQSIGIVELAREAEARGFVSLYLPEHTHIPTSRETPPPTGEAELPAEYSRTLDPFVALAACAEATSTLLLGTGICLVAQHDPIVTAKAVATLDAISGGRFVFGVGFGWNREEMASHGVEYAQRRGVVREKMLAMQRLWADEVAGFEGDVVEFAPSWAWPKPHRSPRPPVLVGGEPGPKLFSAIAEYADGWIPIGGAGVREALPALAAAAEAAGRDPAEFRILPFGTIPDADKLAYYADLGIDEVILRIPSAPRDVVMPKLDAFARFVASS